MTNGFGPLTWLLPATTSAGWPPSEPGCPAPLAPPPLQGHRRYYEAVRPCAPRRYAAPCRSAAWDLPLPADGHTDQPVCRGDRFPCSTQEPEPRSRHLHAGHHLASRQAPARLIPEQLLDPGFDVIKAVSTRHQWFASARLRDSHLTRSRRAVSATLTTPALDRRSLRWFAASPAGRLRGAHPHLLCSTAPERSPLHRSPPSRSWHTEVAGYDPRGLPAQERPPAPLSTPRRRVKPWARKILRIELADTRQPTRNSSPWIRW
jgi:hypothetical protein